MEFSHSKRISKCIYDRIAALHSCTNTPLSEKPPFDKSGNNNKNNNNNAFGSSKLNTQNSGPPCKPLHRKIRIPPNFSYTGMSSQPPAPSPNRDPPSAAPPTSTSNTSTNTVQPSSSSNTTANATPSSSSPPSPPSARKAFISRSTKETQIQLSLSLDGGQLDLLPDLDRTARATDINGAPVAITHQRASPTDRPDLFNRHANQTSATQQIWIWTGVGFLDHMLHALAKHAGWSLRVRVVGDLYSM